MGVRIVEGKISGVAGVEVKLFCGILVIAALSAGCHRSPENLDQSYFVMRVDHTGAVLDAFNRTIPPGDPGVTYDTLYTLEHHGNRILALCNGTSYHSPEATVPPRFCAPNVIPVGQRITLTRAGDVLTYDDGTHYITLSIVSESSEKALH